MSGTLVSGSALLRLAYVDEAGLSNPKEEPILVVAGFVINADQDWLRLVWHLKAIARQYLPKEDRPAFVFHAKDLWHGSGYFNRDFWPRAKRMEILEKIIEIPKAFHLPVVAGFIPRLEAEAYYRKQQPDLPAKTIRNLIHSEAYLNAVLDVNFWMNQNAPNEVAMLICENNDQAKEAIKVFHKAVVDEEDEFWFQKSSRSLNLDRVIDTVHFAEKNDSALLQIADFCAFVVKRHLMGKSDSAQLFEAIKGNIVSSNPLDWTNPTTKPSNAISQSRGET